MMLNKIISICIILLIGTTIKKTIEEECPKVYQEYLKDRAKMPLYKRIFYLK